MAQIQSWGRWLWASRAYVPLVQVLGRRRLNLNYMDYPYRIDPWKRFSGTLAVTQPLYQGGQTVANFNSAKLQVINSELQLQVDRQDLILAVYQAYYQMMLGEMLLEVNIESISTLKQLKSLNEKFLRAGTVDRDGRFDQLKINFIQLTCSKEA